MDLSSVFSASYAFQPKLWFSGVFSCSVAERLRSRGGAMTRIRGVTQGLTVKILTCKKTPESDSSCFLVLPQFP